MNDQQRLDHCRFLPGNGYPSQVVFREYYQLYGIPSSPFNVFNDRAYLIYYLSRDNGFIVSRDLNSGYFYLVHLILINLAF